MKYKKTISERVRKDPDEEKARLQSRLSRAKTLGQQTRVADALSAARAAAGEKKPSDKRSWGASTGTARQLQTTTVRRTPSGVSKLLARRLAPLKRVDTKWIDEGASTPKLKRSTTPTPGTFRAGMDTEATPDRRSLQPLRRRTDAEGNMLQVPKTAKQKAGRAGVADKAVSGNLKNSDMLLQTMNLKPEGTKFEIYGTKAGKEYVVKVSKVRYRGELVYMMAGGREVTVTTSGAGLQIQDASSRRAILTNGNDMIWESADLTECGRLFIGESKDKGKKKSWLEIIRAAQAVANPEALLPAPKETAKKKLA
jgi:hypothetical protein